MAFPTNPILGQIHSEYGNSYYFDGVTWIVGWAKPLIATHVVATGVTPATAAPLMWIDTKTRKLYKQENNEWVFIQDLDDGFGSAPNLDVPVSYKITAPSSVNEGSSINIQVETTGIDNGQTISYTITGVSALDIGVPTGGSMLVTNNSASINIPLLADQTTEGGETINFTVAGEESVQILVNDISLSPIYNIVASSVSVAEGASATFTVNTQNVADNTTVNYAITGIEAGDINVPLTGTLTIVGATAQLQLTPTEDALTEGVQTITFTLVGKGVSSTINILDTSKTPIYTATASASSADEGTGIVIEVATQNVADGTTVDYEITGVEAEDIDVPLTGTLTVNSSMTGMEIALSADLLTEGTQALTFTLTGKGVYATVNINDTSIEPVIPSGMVLEATVGAGQENVSIGVAQLNLYPSLYPTDTVEIDWGDGSTSSASGQIFSTQAISHTYAAPGTYDITISGGSGWLRLTGYGDLYLTNVLTDIKAWGSFKWTSMNTSFAASKFSTWSATDKPDFSLFVVGAGPSRVGGCPGTFAMNTALSNPPIGNWDMHLASSSSSMFSGCTNFNGPVDQWTTPGTGDLQYMFSDCTNFNKDISGWDTSGVTGMSFMFEDCPAFNQNIGGWNTANVTSVVCMFRRATSMNQDLSLWNMIKCKAYVEWASFADEVPLWTQPKPVWGSAPTVSTGVGEAGYPADELVFTWTGTNFSHAQFYPRNMPGTSTSTQCEFIFGTNAAKTASSSNNFPSAGTYTIRVRNLRGFTLPAGWNDILQWPTSQYAPQTQLSYMTNTNPTSSRGANATITAQVGPNLSQTTTLESMFMTSTFNINLSQWDVSFVKTFSYMFYGATGTITGLTNWDTSSATAMGNMFQGATKFNEDLSGWCVSGVATQPASFSTGATLWTLPKPVWGTCP